MNGINKVVHNLAIHQSAVDRKAEVWGITSSPEAAVDPRPYTLRLFRAGGRFRIDSALKAAIGAEKGNKTIFHLHGGFIPAWAPIGWTLRQNNIPYVFCPHGAMSPGALKKSGWKKRLYFQLFEKRLLAGASVIQLLGKNQYEHLEEWVIPQRKVLIPNGQNLSELAYEILPLTRPDVPIFSFCGRLDQHYKALDLVIDAMKQYQAAGGRGHLWLIGDGADRQTLEEQATALDLHDRVSFWGSKFGEEKLNLLGNSDLFIHPSRSEGLPTGVLEAGGLGLPCLLTQATNLGELFADHQAGWLIDPLSPEAIASSMLAAEHAWLEGRSKAMGEAARQLILQQFNWARVAQELVTLYEEIYE